MTTLRISDEVRDAAIRVSESIHSGERLALTSATESSLLPDGLADMLAKALGALAEGGAVSIAAMPRELTTTEAARLLGVSRPTVMKWIKDGVVASHKVGSHHRLLATDVVELSQVRQAEQIKALERLRAADEELGLDN